MSKTTQTETTTPPVQKTDMVESLKTILSTPADDWKRVNTSLPGVIVVRAPQTEKKGASLQLEINPMNNFRNKLTIRTVSELKAYREALANPKIEALVSSMAKANGTVETMHDDSIIVI